MKMSNKHLLSIKDLSVKDINNFLNSAEKFLNNKKNKKIKKLSEKNIINLFFEDST
ncbi:MAG: aspartate carbamoyltransferase catalytic subunit, partial [Rickettsiales bacterium]|nr:aspartate carbamoyltransferase catalytic subunit [Rickettsiales bacterium]